MAGATQAILSLIAQHGVEVLAIGNGTGRREVEQFLTAHVLPHCPQVQREIVDEDGASVYSASRVAQEEFPDLDLTIRGAISIARRLQDPWPNWSRSSPRRWASGSTSTMSMPSACRYPSTRSLNRASTASAST